jgi:hypothetical protein
MNKCESDLTYSRLVELRLKILVTENETRKPVKPTLPAVSQKMC